MGMKDSAGFLLDAQNKEEPPEPAKETTSTAGGFKPLDYIIFEHEAVPLPKEIAERLGIGYVGKGIMRGRLVIPLRDETGKLLGYVGYSHKMDPPIKFPPNL
jgi:hypothetical protein